MRCFALLALISTTVLGTCPALVLASQRTTVTMDANAYDTRTSGYGCSPNGCMPENTRDGSRVSSSRWSCKEDLANENCEISYWFDVPQDIVAIKISFYNGTSYTRTLKVLLNGSHYTTITSSGTTNGYQYFTLNSDETAELTLESVGLGGSDWISLKEVQFLVL